MWAGRDRIEGARCILKRPASAEERGALGREAGVLLEVRHRSLRRVHDVSLSPDGLPVAVALELVAGESLVSTGAPLSTSALADILAGLEHLHQRGFVHGDLKPDHLLVDRAGRGRLLDLGLVLPIGAHPRGGTPGYLAPEVVAGGAASVAADLYALGKALLAAKERLDARSTAIAAACVEVRPEDRPASALACISALGEERRRIEIAGGFVRVGGERELSLAAQTIARGAGESAFVAAPAGAGRARFEDDLRRLALGRRAQGGAALVRIDLSDPDWVGRSVAALELRTMGDLVRDAAAVAAALARARTGILAVARGDRDRAVLVAMAASIARASAGGLVAIGDLSSEDAAPAGARFETLPRASLAGVTRLFEMAGARLDEPIGAAVLKVTEGRAGIVARLARAAAEQPLSDEPAVARAVRAIEQPGFAEAGDDEREGDPLATAERLIAAGSYGEAARVLGQSSRDEPAGAARVALSALADARRGELSAAVERIAALARPPPGLALLRAQCLERLGEHRAALAAATSLLAIGGAAGVEGVALGARAVAAHVSLALGDPVGAERLANEGLARSDVEEGAALGLPRSLSEVVGRLHAVRSDAALRLGRPKEAAAFAREMVAFAEQRSDDGLLAQAWSRVGAALALGGEPEQARSHYERALEKAERAGDVVGLPAFIMNLATSEHATGRIDRAIEHYQEAAALAKRFDRRANWLAAVTNLAGLWVFLGAKVEAEQLLDEADVVAARISDVVYQAQLSMLRAELARDDDLPRALELARSAREGFERAGAVRQAIEARLLDAELQVAAGAGKRALAFVEDATRELEEAGLAARAALVAAKAHGRAGRPDLGARWSRAAVDAARAIHDRELAARALLEHARAIEPSQPDVARTILEEARAELATVAEGIPPGMRERFMLAPDRRALAAQSVPAPGTFEGALGREARVLLDLVRRVLREGQESRVLEAAIDEAVALTGAERALLVLDRRATGGRGGATGGRAPEVAVARNMDRTSMKGGRLSFSRSVAAKAIRTGESVVTASAADDPQIEKTRSVMDLGLRSILCVPIRGPSKILGAIYLDHRIERGRFGAGALEVMSALADIVGLALENARLFEEARRRALELERHNEAIALESERRAAEVTRLVAALEASRAQAPTAEGGIVGRSHKLLLALDVARRVAPSDLPVLVRGESGTGKELFARYVHARSLRAGGPFVAINCGAVPETLLESELFGHKRGAFTGATTDHAGLFRQADGGTLFLDEIGEMPLRMQTRLLRVLQEGEVRPLGGSGHVRVDVRIVAATHRNLEEAVTVGTFREDLFYRLLGARVMLPPLRERRDDVVEIAREILERLQRKYGRTFELTHPALDALIRHDWPGNVRELEQTLTRAALLSDGGKIDASSLDLARPVTTRRAELQGFDRALIEQALAAAKDNRTLAARALGVSRVTLHRWMKRYGVS